MDEETELLNSQINALKLLYIYMYTHTHTHTQTHTHTHTQSAISSEEGKAAALGERANPHKGQTSSDQDIEAMLASMY